jgi:DNA-binding MarR family transcriptional regulator
MLRDEEDLQLLAELAGVLDQTVSEAGLSAGSYLILRELVANPAPHPVTALAERLGAEPEELTGLCSRLIDLRMAEAKPNGIAATERGVERAAKIEADANEAMRAYVMDRPHTATVYGLVASMQSGRFTVEDLLGFLAESAAPDDEGGAA